MHDGAKKYPAKNLTSGPTAPDIELFFAPFLTPPLNGQPYSFPGLTSVRALTAPLATN
jgi:hypothetical protein